MTIGEFLSQRRKQLGLSYDKVGVSLNYTGQAIYRYEKGKVKVSLENVIPLCKALDMSVASFFRMDIDRIEPFVEGEFFSQKQFSSHLSQRFHREAVDFDALSLKMRTSKQRILNWLDGSSLPTVEELMVLADVLLDDPVDLFFGRNKEVPVSQPMPAFYSGHESIHVSVSNGFRRRMIACVCSMAAILLLVCGSSFFFASKANRVADKPTGDDVKTDLDSTDKTQPSGGDSSFVNPPDEPDSSKGESPSIESPSENPVRDIYYSVFVRAYDCELDSDIPELSQEIQVKPGECVSGLDLNAEHYQFVTLEDADGYAFDLDTPIYQNTVIKAEYIRRSYNVVFYTQVDRATILSSQMVKYLDSAKEPEYPYVLGREFLRWSQDFHDVQSNLEIYPLYSIPSYQITLDFDGGNVDGQTDNMKLNDLDMVNLDSLPAPEKEGYTFLYYAYEGKKVDRNTVFRSSFVTLVAVYEANEYTIRFRGSSQILKVRYQSAFPSLPSSLDDGSSVDGWYYQNDRISSSSVYCYPYDITLSSFSFLKVDECDCSLKPDGTYRLDKVNVSRNGIVDLSTIGGIEISEIMTGAVSDCDSLTTLVFNQKKIKIHSGAFSNLSSLRQVYFNQIGSDSVFDRNVFSGCDLDYLVSGNPIGTDRKYLKLKDYGIVGKDTFRFGFNDNVVNMPDGFTEDFGILGEFNTGNNLKKINDSQLSIKGCTIRKFVPGVSLEDATLNLPDIDQDEMAFCGSGYTCLVRFVGDKLGHIGRFSMENGAYKTSAAIGPLCVDEFDFSRASIFNMNTNVIYAKKGSISQYVSSGTFANYDTEKLQLNIYGSERLSISNQRSDFVLDPMNTEIFFHKESRVSEDRLVDYPMELLTFFAD